MDCPENYKKCKCYHRENRPESRCIKDSNIGYCIKELDLWKKEVDTYFEEYDNSEIIS